LTAGGSAIVTYSWWEEANRKWGVGMKVFAPWQGSGSLQVVKSDPSYVVGVSTSVEYKATDYVGTVRDPMHAEQAWFVHPVTTLPADTPAGRADFQIGVLHSAP